MMISLDANIFIYANTSGEKIKNKKKREEWIQLHKKADVIYTDMLKGKHIVLIPSVIVAEVCAVISRMTNSEEEGMKAANEIQQYCIVIYESASIFEELLPLIAKVKGSGIDSILASVAVTDVTTLVTNDRKLFNLLEKSQLELDLRLLAGMNINEIKSWLG